MDILITSATINEIKPLADYLGCKTIKKYGFGSADYKNNSIHIFITGIGIMQTAFCMGSHLMERDTYDLIINMGIAGSFDRKIKLGETVNVVKDRIADIGAEDGDDFLDAAELGLLKSNQISFTSNLKGFKNISALKHLKKVNAITVNKVHGNEISIQKILKKYKPQTESMEGAAFFYIANFERIPCIQIRAISNYVERRNKNNWNIPLAIRNLNKTAIKLLKDIL